jgi:LPS-assembly protein
MNVGKYVQIKNGLFKVKGVDVIYLPYLVIPMLSKRESGLLVPKLINRPEGFALEQPIFWAISDHKDATITPTFWGPRGYGTDLQYRQRFNDSSWFELNTRMLNDTIYEPGKRNLERSGDHFFRHFTELETHQLFSPDLNSHIRYTDVRDLDMVRDFAQYTDPRINSSDLGLNGFLNWRQDLFSLNSSIDYNRNQLAANSVEFDRSYVQTVPRLKFDTVPHTLLQSKIPMFQHISAGADGSFTRFRQVNRDDTLYLRNADRVSVQPYLMWHFFTAGPVSMNSRYVYDQQSYQFADPSEPNAGKNAGIVRTEISFSMDKIFGLAYEEKIPLRYISDKDLQRLRESKEQGLTPIQKEEKPNRLVGDLPEFQSELSKDNIVQVRNSYRHNQEFKFIHHYLTHENQYGNKRFLNQINTPFAGNSLQAGIFDIEDAPRDREFEFSAVTRTMLPINNTAELQWNNSLIRKTPKYTTYLEDERYLRDNFTYSKISWFNVSQGYFVENNNYEDYRQRLSRLSIDTGYYGDRWNVGAQEYYFHYENRNIFSLNFNRRFEYLNLFSRYNYNSFAVSRLNTLSVGGQVRPTDVLGFALVKDTDLQAKKDMRTIYSIDIMPHNNCWIFNLNYRQSITNTQYSFNIIFNFGDDKFDRYRNDYFAVKRVQ